MAFRSRIARLTAAALALPAGAAIALLPGTAAQAAGCGADQAAVHFVNGSFHCQDYGSITYIALRPSDRIQRKHSVVLRSLPRSRLAGAGAAGGLLMLVMVPC